MKLVSNWRSALRWHSTHALTLIAVLPIVWLELPADLKAYVPPEWRPFVLASIAVAGIVARLRDQGTSK